MISRWPHLVDKARVNLKNHMLCKTIGFSQWKTGFTASRGFRLSVASDCQLWERNSRVKFGCLAMMKLSTATLLHLVVLTSCFDLQVNDVCRSEYLNADGICIRPEKCEHFAEHRKELKICAFDGKVPLVCCPKVKSTKKRRSEISTSSWVYDLPEWYFL